MKYTFHLQNKRRWLAGSSLLVAASAATWGLLNLQPDRTIEAVSAPDAVSSPRGKVVGETEDLHSSSVNSVVASSTIKMTPEELEATANAQPCDGTVLTALDLSRPPTEQELIAAGNLGDKLTPTANADPGKIADPGARKKQQEDNWAFGHAIQAWNAHEYDEAMRLFEEHLESFPGSPWEAESMLHIGCHHQYTARFSESVEWFDKILAMVPKGTEMYHKAKLRRTIINIDLGNLEAATTGFSEMMQEDPNPNRQTYASYWLLQTQTLKANETAIRDCGQKALSHAARLMGDGGIADELYQLTAAGPHGFTAAELHTTALQYGIDTYPVRADMALDHLPVPFIAHYTDRHYVTVESVSKDVVRLYDNRISASTDMPRKSFEKNWSGFALLFENAPELDGIHKAEDLNDIVGGCCGKPTLPSDLGDDDSCDASCGLPTYSVNPVNMNFMVKDTPMWWDAPVGPSVYMTLLFNSQDSLNNYEPFGEKWSFEYASYLLITPGSRVQVKDGSGRMETFAAPTGGGATHVSPAGDFRVLERIASHTYTLTHQDGTVYKYGLPPEVSYPNYTPPPAGESIPDGQVSLYVPLLMEIKDRHNNTLSIKYNSWGAITQILHSALPGKSWNLVYSNFEIPSGATSITVSRVVRIDDPFSRSAKFVYDEQARLVAQTDMGGLRYSYGYTSVNAIDASITPAPTTASPQLLVNKITTPTGTTSIVTEPADGVANPAFLSDYSTEELAQGYRFYYPPPGEPMWTNYRITVRDHLGNPSEYFFNGSDVVRYYRDPVQMIRPHGKIRPSQGARTELKYSNVGGKGAIGTRSVLADEISIVAGDSFGLYNNSTRLPGEIPDGAGGVHAIEYNPKGKPTVIRLNNSTDPDRSIEMTYVSPGGVDIDTIKRKFGGVDKTIADFSYYPNRDVQSITDVNGRILTFVWRGDGLIQQITDSLTGDVTTFTYDANKRPYTMLVNGQIVRTTVYDSSGVGVVSSDLLPDGRYSTYEYDGLNRLTRELRSDDSFTAWQWACCYIESMRDGKIQGGVEKTLRKTQTYHDKRALPLFVTDTAGNKIRYGYDISGRLTNLVDAKGQETKWIYNGAGQLIEKQYPDLTKENFTYYRAYVVGVGQPSTYLSRSGKLTTFTYTPEGLLSNLSGDNQQVFEYDSWLRPWKRTLSTVSGGSTYLTTGVTTFAHDLMGRLTSLDGPLTNDTILYSYNDAARSVTRTSPGGRTETITADAFGRVASIANILGTFSNVYDGVGGPLTQINHTGVNAGFNTSFTYHGDEFNQALASITSTRPGGSMVAKHSYTYDPLGQIRTWKREAGLPNPGAVPTHQFESTIFYDLADQVSSVLNKALPGSTTQYGGYHYNYDSAGNIASRQVESSTSGATMTSYGHNSLNQITSMGGGSGVQKVIVRGDTNEPATVKVKPGTSSLWKDARMLEGNRFEADVDLATGANQINIRAEDSSSNVSNYTYGLHLSAAAAASPTYDNDGNMTSDGVRNYEWDRDSRLVKITWGGSPVKTTEFRYNAMGQRSERIEKSGTSTTAHYYYLYEGIRLICRYQGGHTEADIDRHYVSQGEQRKNGGAWDSYYYTRDHLGSVREVLKSSGTLAARYDYDPYGRRLQQYKDSSYVEGCELGYTGHVTLESAVSGQSEIVLTHFRAYSPELGRWLSADPIGESGGINLYGYVLGDPINGWDPYGLKFWTWGDSDNDDWFPSAGEIAETAFTFGAGMGDHLTFGGTELARGLYAGNNNVDKCSDAYKGGTYAGVAVDFAASGGSLALSKSAANVTARQLVKDRRILRGALGLGKGAKRNGQTLYAHHSNPLKGHPGGSASMFPTAGLPSSIKNSRFNGKALTHAEHVAAHQRLRRAETTARKMGMGSIPTSVARTTASGVRNSNCD